MDLLLAAIIGGVVGYLIGRANRSDTTPESAPEPPKRQPTAVDRINQRLTKRQQRILASLPQDDPRPTLDDLIVEEATRLGIPDIPADADIPLGVRLAVFKRDVGEAAADEPDQYEYNVAQGSVPPFEIDDVRLVRRTSDE